MRAYARAFMRRGRVARGVAEEVGGGDLPADRGFAGYAFCKAHSASFALESFESAYWKAHYPAEFMAAVLSNRGGYYTHERVSRGGAAAGARDPSAVRRTRARVRHRGRGRELRVGLMQVKGLSAETAEKIVAGRPYRSLAEFLEKVPASRDVVETLIRCGAMSSFGRTRPELLWELRILRPGPRDAGRDTRNGGGEERHPVNDAVALIRGLPRIPEYDLPRRIALELETLDVAVSAHPLEMYEKRLSSLAREPRLVRSVDLAGCVGGRSRSSAGRLPGNRRAPRKRWRR